MCHLPFLYILGKFSLVLCLKELISLDDFNSDGRLFHILGPRKDCHLCPAFFSECKFQFELGPSRCSALVDHMEYLNIVRRGFQFLGKILLC